MSDEDQLLANLKAWLGVESAEYPDEQLRADIRHACRDEDAYERARNLESLGYAANYELVEALR